MASRFISTNRLSNIIQMVTLSKQSGILRATRGQGPQREMGQIRFIAGEPVSALLGSLTGGTALAALSNWGECLYTFDEIAAAEGDTSFNDQAGSSTPYTAPISPTHQSHPSPSLPPMSAGSWPSSYGYPSTSSLNSFGAASPMPDFGSSGDSLGADFLTQGGAYNTPSGGYGALGGDPYAPMGGASGVGAGVAATTATSQLPLRPEQLLARPRRTSLSEQVEQLPLDRRERMVLLLVDGQRSVADLVKLTRRGEGELYSVLNHLRILGLVQL